MYYIYIYIPLLKINKINFITVLSLNFLKIGQLDKIVQESIFPSAFGFREYGFLQVCTFPYSGNKQWITDSIDICVLQYEILS